MALVCDKIAGLFYLLEGAAVPPERAVARPWLVCRRLGLFFRRFHVSESIRKAGETAKTPHHTGRPLFRASRFRTTRLPDAVPSSVAGSRKSYSKPTLWPCGHEPHVRYYAIGFPNYDEPFKSLWALAIPVRLRFVRRYNPVVTAWKIF